MTLPCAARSTLVYLERGDAPRCTKALSPFNQTSWQEMWCPGVILGPSNTQLRVSECLMWDYYMILSQLNGDPCPAWTTERGKLKRGWSPGDSLNLVRVLSVRVNYSQQCRNDINGRWEYSKSIMAAILSRGRWVELSMSLNPSVVKAGIFQENWVNDITADELPSHQQPQPLVLAMRDKQIPAFSDAEFQLP